MAIIVLADDEQLFRSLLARDLKDRDHRVLEAGDGAEALNLIHINGAEILISDVGMPHLDGFELVRAARALVPGLRVILYTCSVSRDKRRQGQLVGVDAFFEKPFETSDLIGRVEALSSGSSNHGS